MGRCYKRKTCRASWTAEALNEAMSKVTSKELGINKASRQYGIPSRTLRRHLASGKGKGPLGRCPELSFEYEKKLVSHIQALEKVGFSPNKDDVQSLAYALAEKMNLEHRFSQERQRAGDDWFYAFMRRNKEIVLRKSEGLSLARAQGMNRKDVEDYFNVLKNILIENDLMNKPGKIYNVDESGIQVNNKAGRVLATKGAKEVYTITSSEKGENVTVIACCSAEGQFLPPVLIFKGKNKKPEFTEGLPPGSDVYMNQKSSYINSDLFYKWFTEHFLPKKGTGKALLLLDGHGSHSNSIGLLEAAAANDVILLCLPSHTTHALQPLDRAFFKPLKTYFNQETRMWITNHKEN
ncbi:unnamed protein product [Euphydryas editha]|uniref:HTH CENPB-type domain-containing protein n=1 Tax=Euphydryas editha TaxID=104508 RepID=A0AAU9TWT2_EUPED|nr:unnamed protein product [Euphydryas editha]